ncbi:neuromedin U [Halieaceae bacterium IMCC14734]|uniref:Neuromedin U n=1 Tax=Candidatus Litorirhabdus singularis TaxID=2518993 RepID=A0ABT3TNS2_9GAMM|nr:hypothetical protein [Candidatus Litorirhabdus singularis]MCX2983420.1 neuromedin U [Candidatus Litorirhabdus singularis]
MRRQSAILIVLLAGAALITSSLTRADSKEDDLAKQSQNPLASLSTVLLEYNYEDGANDENVSDHVLNLKPVHPFSLEGGDTVIARAVVPLINLDERASGFGGESGMGDVNMTAWYVPAPTGDINWGAGPTMTVPSHTNDALGSDVWTAGVSFVAVTSPGNWLVGMLVQNQWDFAGDSDEPDVNQFLFQYFLNYNFESGWYLTSTPVITADWEASSDDRWRIPLGGGAGKVIRIGGQAVDLKLQGFKYVSSADSAPDWTLQFQFKLLFPQ